MDFNIVAVTACVSGVAHTYMAAERLEKVEFEENPYREGGIEVQKDEVLSLLNEASVIEIYH